MARRRTARAQCCAGQDIHDARRLAETLGIPHYVLDYESRFREAVIDPVRAELHGRRDAGALRLVQTDRQVRRFAGDGALAGRRRARDGPLRALAPCRSGDGAARHVSARWDESRDQSWFLFATTQAPLDYLRFPLGGLSKQRTRELAREFGLFVRRNRTARTSASCRRANIPT